MVGGSTITQQLAKNLLLSGERNLLRKGQELVLTLMLERC
jgi:monofunctional glycosyltransferase